jgi:7-cyano-7-deazaguanine synthase
MAATVLISGGLDSTVLLHMVAKKLGAEPIYALSFDYGQKHPKELAMAKWQCDRVPSVAEHIVTSLPDFAALVSGASSLVSGGGDVPDLSDVPEAERDQPPTYVPNRNMILLSLAAAFAESRGCEVLYYGAQAQDEYGYWDCTDEFIRRINDVLSLNRRNPVRVEAPFAHLRKSEEIRLGLELGVDFAHTWTCYRGGAKPCGLCPTCVERLNAFAEVGMTDPLEG